MRILKLKKKNLPRFLKSLSSFGELWAPVKKGDAHVFQKITDPKEIDLQARRTILPIKKLIHPPRFKMFDYDGKGYRENLSDIERKVVFGIHPCDIHGLLILDQVFMEEHPDPYYIERRKNTAIIGVSCIPDEYCFCNETGTDVTQTGYDLFFSEIGTDFMIVWVGSSLGDDLVRTAEQLFDENITVEEIEKFIDWKEKRDKHFTLDINLTAMPDLFELKINDKVWDKIGERCLACGACTMVCPTCNCFNVVDENALEEKKGARKRIWDACTLHEYSLVAEGHNFRESRADRMRLWYTHKLRAFIGAYGDPSCVGCGRCIVTCPVNINVFTVVKTLRGEEVFF